ncbi:serine/threonine-protein kinase BSK3 [Trifolium repens]|nr:serine/threonine-protein kinase BSK3 [Trifolium repens]
MEVLIVLLDEQHGTRSTRRCHASSIKITRFPLHSLFKQWPSPLGWTLMHMKALKKRQHWKPESIGIELKCIYRITDRNCNKSTAIPSIHVAFPSLWLPFTPQANIINISCIIFNRDQCSN